MTRRTAGAVPNAPDFRTFKSLETLEKTQELFETIREAGAYPNGVTLSSWFDAIGVPSGVPFK